MKLETVKTRGFRTWRHSDALQTCFRGRGAFGGFREPPVFPIFNAYGALGRTTIPSSEPFSNPKPNDPTVYCGPGRTLLQVPLGRRGGYYRFSIPTTITWKLMVRIPRSFPLSRPQVGIGKSGPRCVREYTTKVGTPAYCSRRHRRRKVYTSLPPKNSPQQRKRK